MNTPPDLLAAHAHASKNRAELEASTRCGCFWCQEMFTPAEIVAWGGLDMASFENPDAAEGETALCPHCGVEAVIGDRSGFDITPQFLARMHEAWFQRTLIRPSPKKG